MISLYTLKCLPIAACAGFALLLAGCPAGQSDHAAASSAPVASGPPGPTEAKSPEPAAKAETSGPSVAESPKPKPHMPAPRKGWSAEDDFLPDVLTVEPEDGRPPSAGEVCALAAGDARGIRAGPAGVEVVCPVRLDVTASYWVWVRAAGTGAEPGECVLRFADANATPLAAATSRVPAGRLVWVLVKSDGDRGAVALRKGEVSLTLAGTGLMVDKIVLSRDAPDEWRPEGALGAD